MNKINKNTYLSDRKIQLIKSMNPNKIPSHSSKYLAWDIFFK